MPHRVCPRVPAGRRQLARDVREADDPFRVAEDVLAAVQRSEKSIDVHCPDRAASVFSQSRGGREF